MPLSSQDSGALFSISRLFDNYLRTNMKPEKLSTLTYCKINN